MRIIAARFSPIMIDGALVLPVVTEAALMIRLGRGPLTADQVHSVAAVLDRAASEIEQG